MNCPMCGAANADAATACVACGTALAPPAAAPAAPLRRPAGVAVLAIIDFLAAALYVVAGVIMLAMGGIAGSLATHAGGVDEVPAGFMAIFALAGAFVLAFGVVLGVLGWGLWKGRNWARIAHLVLAVLGVAFSALALVGGLASLGSATSDDVIGLVMVAVFVGLYGFVAWYLVQPGVKRWFGA